MAEPLVDQVLRKIGEARKLYHRLILMVGPPGRDLRYLQHSGRIWTSDGYSVCTISCHGKGLGK